MAAPPVTAERLGWARRPAGLAGWPSGNADWPALADGNIVSRVAAEHRGAYELLDPSGQTTAGLDAAMRDAAKSPFDYPTVGDWVVRSTKPKHDQRMVIGEVLARTSLLCRRAAGARIRPQLVAANADVLAVVVAPTTRDSNQAGQAPIGHRIEWYLTAAFGGGAQPVVVINKIDMVSETECRAVVDTLRARLGALAGDVPILATSALDGRGLDALAELTAGGATVALSGPSGVGKSSLVNRLAGAEVVPVGEIGGDGRGRHTTVRRQLVPVGGHGGDTGGGTLVDTPGLGDLIPWGGDVTLASGGAGSASAGLHAAFSEIADLARLCRFGDCVHAAEPDCAVKEAVAEGELAAERLAAYLELAAELSASAD